MPDGKSRYKYEQFFPVAQHVSKAKSGNKENMIEAIEIGNMLNAHRKEYAEIAHVKYTKYGQNLTGLNFYQNKSR